MTHLGRGHRTAFTFKMKRVFIAKCIHYTRHNSPIYDECQTQSPWVLALPYERAHQDNQKDTPQPICEFQVDFPLLWIEAYPDLS